ncbi:hypothetical protein [Yoonia sp.]|uniref:hypothetical protein n=1 Tax=Yoonia sp. TaxID=2212373 RepID=UPI001A0427B9|nr:hypothetical protein [Yoonia sp.]MBE0413521.1 hypothetical protein [Yoonia sp.]
MQRFLTNFYEDDAGAVTVDFVVLTAAMVALALLIMSIVGGAAEDQANWLKDTMLAQPVN